VLKKVAPDAPVVDDAEIEIIPEIDGEPDVDTDGESGAEVDVEEEAAGPIVVAKPAPKAKKGRGRPKK
jgi:hypothetical protein